MIFLLGIERKIYAKFRIQLSVRHYNGFGIASTNMHTNIKKRDEEGCSDIRLFSLHFRIVFVSYYSFVFTVRTVLTTVRNMQFLVTSILSSVCCVRVSFRSLALPLYVVIVAISPLLNGIFQFECNSFLFRFWWGEEGRSLKHDTKISLISTTRQDNRLWGQSKLTFANLKHSHLLIYSEQHYTYTLWEKLKWNWSKSLIRRTVRNNSRRFVAKVKG